MLKSIKRPQKLIEHNQSALKILETSRKSD
jgi:hypothetical protein